jgi:pimeloyl-ACP methyl ester carboxylesterase
VLRHRIRSRNLRYRFLLTAGLLFLAALTRGQPDQLRVACVGSASLFGPATSTTEDQTSPAQLQRLLGDRYQVRTFRSDSGYAEAYRFMPDIVFLELDTLVGSFLRLPSRPRVVLLIPPTVTSTGIPDSSQTPADSLFISRLQQRAYESGCEIVNLRTFFLGLGHIFWKERGPTPAGAGLLASRLNEAVSLGNAPQFDLLAASQIRGSHTSYFGFDCCDFTFEGRNAKIVSPKRTAPGRPWIWRARFWGHEPQTEIALLERGFHLVFCDVSELFGNSEAIGIWNRFYEILANAGLSTKTALEGFSRGGLYIYRWAVVNADRVACIYADAPVLDFKSWPGGKGRGGGNPAEWERFKLNFGLASEQEALAFTGNPLDLAREIAAAGFPMLHVCGDADRTVPIEENTDIFEKKILTYGGHITVIRKPGIGHHPHSLPNPQPIVDFILNSVGKQ